MIVYVAIANFNLLLSEFAVSEGTFHDIAHKLLRSKGMPDYDTRTSYAAGDYKFHLLVEDGVRYLCLADHQDGHRVPFLALEEVATKFRDKFGLIGKTACDATPFRVQFSPILADIMAKYADPTEVDKIKAVHRELERVQDVAREGIDRLMERGERIDVAVEKTNLLTQRSAVFQKASTKLRHQMWWRNVKMKIVMGASAVAVVGLIGLSVCGWGFSSC